MSEPLKLAASDFLMLLAMLATSDYVPDDAQRAGELIAQLANFAEANQDEPMVLMAEKHTPAAFGEHIARLERSLDLSHALARLEQDVEQLAARVEAGHAWLMELGRLLNVRVPFQPLDPLAMEATRKNLLPEFEQLRVKELLSNALSNDAAWHKQWYLWRIAEALSLDLSDQWDADYPKPEEGIAP